MTLRFSKSIYPKDALLKAAYRFTDIAYLHLDCDENYYTVEIIMKDDNSPLSEQSFANELLAQTVRLSINHRSKNIREMIMARALSSTFIEDDQAKNVESDEFSEDPDFVINDILQDWFEANE